MLIVISFYVIFHRVSPAIDFFSPIQSLTKPENELNTRDNFQKITIFHYLARLKY